MFPFLIFSGGLKGNTGKKSVKKYQKKYIGIKTGYEIPFYHFNTWETYKKQFLNYQLLGRENFRCNLSITDNTFWKSQAE